MRRGIGPVTLHWFRRHNPSCVRHEMRDMEEKSVSVFSDENQATGERFPLPCPYKHYCLGYYASDVLVGYITTTTST